MQYAGFPRIHCVRSEAIQNLSAEGLWIGSSQGLLAMTCGESWARNDGEWGTSVPDFRPWKP
jgi:hypothetical protein